MRLLKCSNPKKAVNKRKVKFSVGKEVNLCFYKELPPKKSVVDIEVKDTLISEHNIIE